MLDWILAIVGGLFAGAIAQGLVKGEEPGGLATTIGVGVLGGIVGKIVLSILHLPGSGNPVWNLIVAVIGAVILLSIYQAVKASNRRSR